MKKFKRICALVLTVVMTASVFSFNFTADAVAAEWQTVDCDFSDAELSNGQFTKGPFYAINADEKTNIVDDNGNKYLKCTRNDYRFYPTNFTGTLYTITGRVKFEGTPTDGSYFGFVFRFDNTTDVDSQFFIYYYPETQTLNLCGTQYVNQFDTDTWYTFRIVRTVERLGFCIWADGNGYWETNTTINAVSQTKTIPTFRIMANGGGVCFDDLYYAHGHIWETGFDNVVVKDNGGLDGPVVARGSSSNGTNGGVVIATEEDGNKYLKHVAALNNYKVGPVFNSLFDSYADYTFSGDFLFDFDQDATYADNNYIGLYLLQNTDGNSFNMFYYPNSGFKVNGQVYDICNLGEWMSFKFVRNGTSLNYCIWNREEPSRMVSGTCNPFTTDGGFPTLRFMGGGGVKSPVIGIDNLHYEASTEPIRCVGVQASAVNNGRYSVRFIGTIDSANYSKVGFEIKARTAEGTKSFYVEDCLVYTSITENTDKGIKSYSANDLGGKYLIAIGIHNIPAVIGDADVSDDIEFEITAFCCKAGSDTPIRSKTVICTATNDGSFVVWQ